MAMRNVMPDRYREVSLTTLAMPLTKDSIVTFLTGREVYRRTRYVVLHNGEQTALAAVRKASDDPLFSAAEAVDVLALPADTAWVEAPEVDIGVPSELARVARERAPQSRCVVVHGRHSHVSFILDPAAIDIRVVDVAPPYPAKLFDQARALLAVADDLPPVELVPDIADLSELAATRPEHRYLLPCRGSGIEIAESQTSYLDERPPDADWLLVGCQRSREIHRWFYGRDARYVDTCPRRLAGAGNRPLLTKCCLLEEEEFELVGTRAVLPWGASLTLVRAALGAVVAAAQKEPAWAPE